MLISLVNTLCDEPKDLQNLVIKYEFRNNKTMYPEKLFYEPIKKLANNSRYATDCRYDLAFKNNIRVSRQTL